MPVALDMDGAGADRDAEQIGLDRDLGRTCQFVAALCAGS
jgi:hypothetical protein